MEVVVELTEDGEDRVGRRVLALGNNGKMSGVRVHSGKECCCWTAPWAVEVGMGDIGAGALDCRRVLKSFGCDI